MRVRDIWREDVEKPGIEFPSAMMVALVEFLISEPVWTRRYYNDEGGRIES